MESKRIYLFDNLKFLLILLVVAGHFIDYGTLCAHDECFRSLFVFIYSFHMPLFVFVSGLFYKAENVGRKVLSYLAIWCALTSMFAIKNIISFGKIGLSIFAVSGTPWFMFAMAAFIGLSYVFRKVKKTLLLIVSVTIACFAGYSVHIGDYFALSRIIVFYPFFVAGTMVDKLKLESIVKKKPLMVTGAVVLALWLILCLNFAGDIYMLRPVFTGRNPFPLLPEWMAPYGGLYRLLCYALSSLFSFAVICICSVRRIPCITALGAKTLQIYFWHAPILYFILIIPAVQNMIEANTYSRWGFLLLSIPFTFILALKPFEFPAVTIFKHSKIKKK